MLKSWRSHASFHAQAALASFHALWRRPQESMMTIIVIAIALTLPSLFWVFTENMGQLTENWQQEGHVTLYLKNISPAEEGLVLAKIQGQAGVKQAILKTKTDGLIELQKQEGMRDIMRYLPENPLPAVIEVIPLSAVNNPMKMEQLYYQLKKIPQVAEAKLDLEWITRLHAILGFVSKIGKGLIALLGLAVMLIVGNTLRLAIRNRHEEIKILKLVGAPNSYISRPFLYAGIWYGLLGAIFAVLFINIFMLCLALAAEQLAFVYHMHYPLTGLSVTQAYTIMLVAVIISWFGAGLAIRGQLSSIEPCN